jgi:hypothetical protein
MNNIPDKEFEILIYLRKHENASWIDVLNAFGDYPETHRILKAMLALDLAKITSPGETPPNCKLILTSNGYHAALAEEHRRNQLTNEMANEKARQKADRRFQLLNSLLSAIAGSIITLLIEHYSAVLKALGSFFLWLSSLF